MDAAPAPGVQLDPDDSVDEAIRRAREIYDAFHGSLFTEDEERALNQLRGQSTLMVREIRAQYQSLYSLDLENDFRRYCNEAQYNEALRALWGTLSLGDRIRSNIEPGWLWDSANQTGIMDTLRSASQAELLEAGRDAALMELLRKHLGDDDYFEARLMLQPDQRYEIVVERIRNARGFFDDDEGAVYDALMELSVAERRRLWEENQDVFSYMNEEERARARRMCLGTEADALEARMEAATAGAGTDDEAVHELAERVASLRREEQRLQAALAGGALSDEERARIEARLAELGDIDRLLEVERDEDGELRDGTFLGNLRGDVSEEEHRALTEQMGIDGYEAAKQRILDAVGLLNDDEQAIYEAFDRIEDAELRRRLWNDPDVQRALGHLNEEERETAAAFRDGDSYAMALARIEDAWRRLNANEARIYQVIAGMSDDERFRFRDERLYFEIRGGLDEYERRAFDEVVSTGRLSAASGIDAALGGNWDGTNKELLYDTLRSMSDRERWPYRLGYYLDREGMEPADDEQRAALEAFRSLEERLRGELGTDDFQKALDELIGVPPARELQDEAGRLMAAGIMSHRIDDKQALWGGLGAAFTEKDEAADRMEVQFDAAYAEAMADGTISAEELAVLANLDRRFAERYQESVQASEMVAGIAATAAAVAAGIVVTVLTGGAAGPAVGGLLAQYGAAALAGGIAGSAARVGTQELMAGSHFDTFSGEGANQAMVGFVDGAMAVLSSGLAARFTRLVGLRGAKLSGEIAMGTIDAAGGAVRSAGRQFVAGSVRGGLEGLISGMVGEVVMTAADEATWRRQIWDVVAQFGAAILRGGGIGLLSGGLVGGSLEALGAFVQRSRIESLVSDLESAGIPRSELDTLPLDTVRRIGQLDAAFAASDMNEASSLLAELSGEIDPSRMKLFQAVLVRRYLGESALAKAGLETLAEAADVLTPGFRASADDLAAFRKLCSDPAIAAWFQKPGGNTVDEWYAAIVKKLGADHPIVAALRKEELVALYGYTTNFYQDLNGALRSLDEKQLKRLLPFLRVASSGLHAAPTATAILTRRARSLPSFVDELLQPGNVFSDRAFFSSSLRDDLVQFGGAYVITVKGSSACPCTNSPPSRKRPRSSSRPARGSRWCVAGTRGRPCASCSRR